MDDLEALERKKRELELRRDIAKLERNEEIRNKASSVTAEVSSRVSGISTRVATSAAGTRKLSWLWVGPLTLVGIYLVLGGLTDGPRVVALVGAVFLIPAYQKIFGGK